MLGIERVQTDQNLGHHQCDQIWRNFANKILEVFGKIQNV